MTLTAVMEGLDALETEARRFKKTLADCPDTEVAEELKSEFRQFAEFIEAHAHRCEGVLTEELLAEEEE